MTAAPAPLPPPARPLATTPVVAVAPPALAVAPATAPAIPPAIAPAPAPVSDEPEVRLVNRVLPGDVKLFAPEAGPEGCASGECLPEAAPAPVATRPAVPVELHEADEPEPPAPIAPANRAVGTEEEKWGRVVDAVRQALPRQGKSLSYARFLGFVPEGVKVAFPADASFHRMQVMGLSRAMVEAELVRSLGRACKLIEDSSVQAVAAAPRSIAEVEASDRSSRERGIDDKVRAHPAIRNVIRHLGGSLEHISYLEPAAPRPTVGTATADEGDAGPPVD